MVRTLDLTKQHPSDISKGCAIIDCRCTEDIEETSVHLITKSEDRLLFRALFCGPHGRAFMRAKGLLAQAIKEGKVRGVSPNILS